MSNTLEAKLKLDIAELVANQAKAQMETRKWIDDLRNEGRRGARAVDDITAATKRASVAMRAMGDGGGGRKFALGGAAMQVQDIAVQLQMGTKIGTVFAQQGSQLASYFGPGGMILGGLVAIGGAFVTAGQAAKDGLSKGVAEAQALRKEIQAMLASGGGLPDMIEGLQKLKDIRATFTTPEQGQKAYWTEVLALGGLTGPTGDQKFAAGQKQRMTEADARQQLIRAIREDAEQELRIAEMRAAGNEKAAQSMERQLALTKELARLRSLGLPDEVAANMARTATLKSSAPEVAAATQEKRDRAARIAALRTETEQLAESMLPDDQQLARLKAKLQGILGAAGPSGGVSSVAALGALAGGSQSESLLKDYREALNIQKEITALETSAADRAASRRKQQAAEIKQQLDHAQAKQEQDDKEQVAQTRAKNELAAEMQIDRLRVAGKKEMADIEARRLQITREAYQIQQATGVSEQEALKLARERDALRQRMQQDQPGGRGSTKARVFTEADRQAGWTHPSTRAGKSRMMGGVDAWWQAQNTPSDFQQLQQRGSAFWDLQQRGSAPASPLGTRQAANAAASDAARNNNTVNLGAKEIEALMTMAEGISKLVG